jgi:alkylated DNA repair dioxygenase AlkB
LSSADSVPSFSNDTVDLSSADSVPSFSTDTVDLSSADSVQSHIADQCLSHAHQSLAIEWKPWHALDLLSGGRIGFHVDHLEYSGEWIGGLCLLSSAVMQFRHHQYPERQASALLPRRCFYLQR